MSEESARRIGIEAVPGARSRADARRAGGGEGALERWSRALELALARWRAAPAGAERARSREEAWVLCSAALALHVRRAARGAGRLSRESQEDLVAEKALELVQAFERDLSRAPVAASGLRALVAAVARNGVVDRLRREGLRRELDSPRGREELVRARSSEGEGLERALGREYAAALAACVGTLARKARRVWFLALFRELSSADIGRHPDVGLSSHAVDVAVHRSRGLVRACMQRKGFAVDRLPPGTFAALWDALHPADAPDEEPR